VEGNSDFEPSQEKTLGSPSGSNPFSDSGHDADSIIPLPGSAAMRNSSTSTSSYMTNNFSRPRSSPSSPYGWPTRTSGDGLFSDTSSLSHPDSSYPPSAALASGASNEGDLSSRRSSASEPISTTSRHIPRKPVPEYNLTDPALASSSLAHMLPLPYESDLGVDTAGVQAVHYLIPDMPSPQRR